MVEDDREHISHLMSVVHAASGKIEATELLLYFYGHMVPASQVLCFPVCTGIVAFTNTTTVAFHSA